MHIQDVCQPWLQCLDFTLGGDFPTSLCVPVSSSAIAFFEAIGAPTREGRHAAPSRALISGEVPRTSEHAAGAGKAQCHTR